MWRDGRSGKLIDVHVQYEACRIERECLMDAYERVVPVLRRTLGDEDPESRSTEMALRQVGEVE